jgi:hypothetical protein
VNPRPGSCVLRKADPPVRNGGPTVTDHRSDLRVLALLDRRLRDWPTLTVEEAKRELGVPAGTIPSRYPRPRADNGTEDGARSPRPVPR